MSNAIDTGITVIEISSMDQPIVISTESVTAFVGRALRGPLNTPVLVRSFAQFKRAFGGEWNKSNLGYSAREFFEHGGSSLYIVRVANDASGSVINLPTRTGVLRLGAVEFGSHENLRAAIDLDGIAEDDSEYFNLTVQRLDSDSGLVIDQEIFPRLSCQPENDEFIGDVLLTSTLVRLEGQAPIDRPIVTLGPGIDFHSTYIGIESRGKDGNELSDYDVVGSAQRETGIFALNEIENLNLLYMPPPRFGGDYGPTALLAAELYCRKRGAMLVMDPPNKWQTSSQLIEGYAETGLASANVVTYFPRVSVKGAQDKSPLAIGGALAGLLCKLDKEVGPWGDLEGRAAEFQRHLEPLAHLDEAEQQALIRAGINVICNGRGRRAQISGSVTFGASGQLYKAAANLSVHRTCLIILKNIERGTRWVVFAPDEAQTRERVRSQVHAYLSGLADSGALADDDVFVRCDADNHNNDVAAGHGVHILVSFMPRGWPQPLSFTIHQAIPGTRTSATAFGPVHASIESKAG